MTRIGKAKVCHTVGQLKEALKDLPDYLRFDTLDGEGCMSVETWKITRDDKASYADEKCNAVDESRKPDFRCVTITEGEEE